MDGNEDDSDDDDVDDTSDDNGDDVRACMCGHVCVCSTTRACVRA